MNMYHILANYSSRIDPTAPWRRLSIPCRTAKQKKHQLKEKLQTVFTTYWFRGFLHVSLASGLTTSKRLLKRATRKMKQAKIKPTHIGECGARIVYVWISGCLDPQILTCTRFRILFRRFMDIMASARGQKNSWIARCRKRYALNVTTRYNHYE